MGGGTLSPRPRRTDASSPLYWRFMVPLSAVLITRNEEDTLGDAIESVRFCDEIVVVDSGSTDRTQDDRPREGGAGAGERALAGLRGPAQRGRGRRATRLGAGPGRGRADHRGLASEIQDLRRQGFARRRLPHPPGGLLPGPLDQGHRLVARPAGAPVRSAARPLGRRARARIGAGAGARCCACVPRWPTTPTGTSATTWARSTATRRCGRARCTPRGAGCAPSTCSSLPTGPSSGTTC